MVGAGKNDSDTAMSSPGPHSLHAQKVPVRRALQEVEDSQEALINGGDYWSGDPEVVRCREAISGLKTELAKLLKELS